MGKVIQWCEFKDNETTNSQERKDFYHFDALLLSFGQGMRRNLHPFCDVSLVRMKISRSARNDMLHLLNLCVCTCFLNPKLTFNNLFKWLRSNKYYKPTQPRHPQFTSAPQRLKLHYFTTFGFNLILLFIIT